MSNFNQSATQRNTITTQDLFLDMKQVKAEAKARAKYNAQVLGTLHILAVIEDAVRTGTISGVKASREYGIILQKLQQLADRALRKGADHAGLWASMVHIRGNDMLSIPTKD